MHNIRLKKVSSVVSLSHIMLKFLQDVCSVKILVIHYFTFKIITQFFQRTLIDFFYYDGIPLKRFT